MWWRSILHYTNSTRLYWGHNMHKKNITQLVTEFRRAIDAAKVNGEFDGDFSFSHFPRGCCGDVCDLLGQYLLVNGINSWYVCGNYYGKNDFFQSHAWLLIDDNLIVDITGDQFSDNAIFLQYSVPVYIGQTDPFHALFQVEERNIRKTVPLNSLGCLDSYRLPNLYQRICKYIE